MRRWNARTRLLATQAIVGVNVLVFLLTSLPGGGLAGRGTSNLQTRPALDGPDIAHGDWYRVVTSGFVHYGLLHILFNMLILYRFGEILEPALGRTRFVALYFAALVCGSFGVVLLDPTALTAGASGAVFGLVGAAAAGMRQRGINIWQSGVGGLLVVNLVLTFAVPGISIGGHLGGLVGGTAIGSVMLRSPTNRRSALEGVALAVAVIAIALLGIAAKVH